MLLDKNVFGTLGLSEKELQVLVTATKFRSIGTFKINNLSFYYFITNTNDLKEETLINNP